MEKEELKVGMIERIIKAFKPAFHFHKWQIVHTSPTGLFVKIRCHVCGLEEYDGI